MLSQEFFLLPDESRHFFDSLNAKIKKAEHTIYLFSPAIDEYTLVNALKQRAKRGVHITLITADDPAINNKVLQLALYQNISLFTLSPLRHSEQENPGLHGSFGCMDGKEFFVLTADLNGEKARSNYALALIQPKACEALFRILLTRAKAY